MLQRNSLHMPLRREDKHKKKCEFLRAAADNVPDDSSIQEIHLLLRNKEDNNADNYEQLWQQAGIPDQDKENDGENGNGNKHPLSVIVKEPKGSSYNFEKLFDPDKAWNSLVNLHNDNILDAPQKEPTPKARSRSLRRRNSDPLKALKAFYSIDDEENESKMDSKVAEPTPTASFESGTRKEASSSSKEEKQLEPEEAWSMLTKDTSSYSHTAVKVSRSKIGCMFLPHSKLMHFFLFIS